MTDTELKELRAQLAATEDRMAELQQAIGAEMFRRQSPRAVVVRVPAGTYNFNVMSHTSGREVPGAYRQETLATQAEMDAIIARLPAGKYNAIIIRKNGAIERPVFEVTGGVDDGTPRGKKSPARFVAVNK